jgi:hypothetical protein
MFDRLKKAFRATAEQAREMRSNPGPSDIALLPPGTGAVGGLGAVAPEVVSGYVGMEVRAVRPLDQLGPESSSLIGDKARRRLRESGVGDASLPLGELIAGQNAARVARFRSEGLSDVQIAAIQDKIVEVTEAHQKSGWTVEFANGNRASVQLFDLDSSDSAFAGLQAKYASQHTRNGVQAMQRNPTEFAVERIENSPYEAYYLPGVLAAKGRTHETKATASHLGTMQLDQTLGALAILALQSLEG